MADRGQEGGETQDTEGLVPHLELLRFYETQVLKIARRGLGPKDYLVMGVYAVVALATLLAARTHPLAYWLAMIPLALAPLALLRQTLNDRGVAFRRVLRSASDLEYAIMADQLAELERFLTACGWMYDRQLSHLCEIYQSWRADHREGRAWIGRWMTTCVGYVLSAMVGAAVSSSISHGDDAFTRAMVIVGVFMVMVTGVVVIVGTFLQAADRRSQRLGGLVDRLRAIQIRSAHE